MHPTGEKIRATRLAKRVNAETIASAIGMSRAAYYKREAAGNFTDDELEKIASVLKYPKDELRSHDGTAPAHEQIVRDLARGLAAALQEHDLELSPEHNSELFSVLYRQFVHRGRVERREIDSVVRVIKGAADAQSD